VYFHGGAFVMGGLDFEDDKCYSLALRSRSVVVSVDYRLAPEHAFPVPVEHCYSALCRVAEGAPALGADPARIAVGGCSAGGALAASTALLCLDRGGPRLALQMLLYPVLDASLSSPSIGRLGQGEERRDMERMWRYYLGGECSQAPDAAVPAQRRDLTGLPHAYIAAAELDGLCDEAITYAQRLLHAAVSAELHVWPRCPHAFDLFAPEAEISSESVKEQADALVRFLG
jgi:acetyl esterase/lipase